jgi:hypothetical protein
MAQFYHNRIFMLLELRGMPFLLSARNALSMTVKTTLSVEKIPVVIRLVISWPVKSMA